MGLYDDDNAAATSGDQNKQEYWAAKTWITAFEDALKTKQKEGYVRYCCEEAVKACDAALKIFENHADVKAWREKAEKIRGKCDPKASNMSPTPSYAWGHSEFRWFWLFTEWTRCAHKAGDWATVYERSMNATGKHYNLGGKVKKFDEEWVKYCETAFAEMTALRKEATAKR